MTARRMLIAAVALVLIAASPGARSRGTFALQGGTQKTDGYLSTAAIDGHVLDRHIESFMTKRGGNEPLRDYDVDMTKLLHTIVVSDDFKTFIHIHPEQQRDGRFTIDQALPAPGVYHIYTDGQPKGFGQQVFRYEVSLGSAAASRDLSERSTTATAGPYTVTLSTNVLSSTKESMIVVHVRRNGKPAKDLHPYLGALAHAVFLNARDLTYVHVHPMALSSRMSGMDMGSMAMDAPKVTDPSAPDMMLHVELREAGTYKLWLQFRGGSQLYVAPFVLTAS